MTRFPIGVILGAGALALSVSAVALGPSPFTIGCAVFSACMFVLNISIYLAASR